MKQLSDFPDQSIRRTYEFPELLRNKYRHMYEELDSDSKYVQYTENHYPYGAGTAEARADFEKKHAVHHDDHGHH